MLPVLACATQETANHAIHHIRVAEISKRSKPNNRFAGFSQSLMNTLIPRYDSLETNRKPLGQQSRARTTRAFLVAKRVFCWLLTTMADQPRHERRDNHREKREQLGHLHRRKLNPKWRHWGTRIFSFQNEPPPATGDVRHWATVRRIKRSDPTLKTYFRGNASQENDLGTAEKNRPPHCPAAEPSRRRCLSTACAVLKKGINSMLRTQHRRVRRELSP